MWYKITKSADYVEFENLDSNPLNLNVTFTINCNDSTEEDIVIAVGETKRYNIIVDAEFTFTLEQTVIAEPETKVFMLPFYNGFLKRVVYTLEELFCDCGDCKDCVDYNLLTQAYFKVFTYYTLTKRYYEAYINAVLPCQKCEIMQQLACLVNNERYLGEYNNVQFLKEILAYYYLSFYFAEVTEDNEEEIKKKFNYDKIVPCLKNIDIDCIRNNVDSMGLITINNGSYTNLPPSQVGNISLSENNRVDVTFTEAMFTTEATPVYADPEGDNADAVRIDSLPNPGVLEYNNTPVTVGQIITMADIALGLLIYKAPNQNTASNVTFNYSIRDEGSMTFSS